jgi:hypothetical protein
VGALGEEAQEPLLRLRDRIWPRDPDDIEAMRAGGLDQCRLEVLGQACWGQGFGRLVQKSRSA